MPCWWFREAFADRLLQSKRKKVNIFFFIYFLYKCVSMGIFRILCKSNAYEISNVYDALSMFDMHNLKAFFFYEFRSRFINDQKIIYYFFMCLRFWGISISSIFLSLCLKSSTVMESCRIVKKKRGSLFGFRQLLAYWFVAHFFTKIDIFIKSWY